MKKYISLVFVAIVLLSVAANLRAQEPAEGFILTPDKVRIFYKIEGTGSETLVMVHGGPGNSLESIRPDMELLAKNRRVIYYDQRGSGKSELLTDGPQLGYKNHVADLETLRAHFKLEKMTLFGNSWGGLLISLYAIEHPDRVERLVLDVPAAPIAGFNQDMEDEISRRMAVIYKPEQLKRFRSLRRLEAWQKAKDPIAHCREVYHTILAVYTDRSRSLDTIKFKGDVCAGGKDSVRNGRVANGHAWSSLGDYNIVAQLAAVKAPVLVIHGASDVIQIRGSEFYAFGYPNARLLIIQNAGHIAHVETPEIFFPAVEAFLKGSFPAEAKKIDRTPGH